MTTTQSRLDLDAGVQVVMTKSEMLQAYMVGATRQVDNVYAAVRNTYEAPEENQLGFNLHGALAEKVVAKHYNVYWSGALGDYRAKDVAGAQVRGTPRRDGHLIVHRHADGDAADDPFILVTGLGPRFMIRGWIMGRDAQVQKYWTTILRNKPLRNPAFFVPQEDLEPIQTLVLPWSPR